MRLAALVLVAGCGATPVAPTTPPEKTRDLNKAGDLVDIDRALVGDRVTVIDFWSQSCGACYIVGGMLAIGVAKDDRIVIRKVDVGDGDTPVAHHYQVNALPHYRVYDKHKRLRYVLTGNDCTEAATIAKQLADER